MEPIITNSLILCLSFEVSLQNNKKNVFLTQVSRTTTHTATKTSEFGWDTPNMMSSLFHCHCHSHWPPDGIGNMGHFQKDLGPPTFSIASVSQDGFCHPDLDLTKSQRIITI